jgi:hypothetical protein
MPAFIIAISALSAVGAFKGDQLAEDFVSKSFTIKNNE